MIKKIKSAIISLSDKSNLKPLLLILKKNNIKLISSGGTYKTIRKYGFNCLEVSKYNSLLNPITLAINSANCLMVKSVPDPILMTSLYPSWFIRNKQAEAISSTCRNSRLAFQLPQTTTCFKSDNLASWTFLINAGITWEVSRLKLSYGPYRFVGITEMKSVPYWRL